MKTAASILSLTAGLSSAITAETSSEFLGGGGLGGLGGLGGGLGGLGGPGLLQGGGISSMIGGGYRQ